MKLLDAILDGIGAFAASAKSSPPPIPDVPAGMTYVPSMDQAVHLLREGNDDRAAWARELGKPWLNAAVMIGLRWYSANMAQVDPAVFTVGRDKEPKPDVDHPWLETFGPEDAGPDGMAALFQLATVSDLVWGETFLYQSEYLDGSYRWRWCSPEVAGMVEFMRPVAGASGYAHTFERWKHGRLEKVYSKDQVCYLQQMPDPSNPTRGLSSLRSGMRAIVGLERGDTLAANILKGGTAKKAILNESGTAYLTAEAEKVQAQLSVPTEHPNRVPIVDLIGPGQVVDIGLSPAEMDMESMLGRPTAIVLGLMMLTDMAFGLNLSGGRSTYNNVAEAKESAKDWGFVPWLARLRLGLTPHLIRSGVSRRSYFDFDTTRSPLFKADFDQQVTNFVALFGAKYGTRNECRVAVGLPPADGPAGDLYADGSTDGKPLPIAPPAEPGDDEKDQTEDEGEDGT